MKIIYYCIIFIVMMVVFLNNGEVFAYTAGFEEVLSYSVVKDPPVFCVLEPDYNPILPKNTYELLMKEAKNSIFDWQNQLKVLSRNPDGWDMKYVEIPIYEKYNYDYSKCDKTIEFLPIPESNEPFEYLGVHIGRGDGKSRIIITYQEIGTCLDPNSIRKFNRCYSDKPAPIFQIGLTLRHEIGHGLGLGHYVSDDEKITQQWGSYRIDAPSIMVPIGHGFSEFEKITSLDVKKLIEIYGDKGWGSLPPVEEPNIVDTLDFSNVQTRTILIKRGEVVVEKISGKITSVELMRGKDAELILIKPDGTHENARIQVMNNGYFEYPFRVDDNLPKGKYQVQISYFGEEVKKIEFEVTDKIPTEGGQKVKTKEKSSKTKEVINKSKSKIQKNSELEKNKQKIGDKKEKSIIKNIVKEGDLVTLGSGVNIGDSVRWKQIGGEKVKLSSTIIAEPWFKAPDVEKGQVKTLTFRVTLKDKLGKSDTDTITINILPRN